MIVIDLGKFEINNKLIALKLTWFQQNISNQ